MTDASPARPLPNPGWGPLSALPGNPLMWVLILSEVVVFTAFFALYAWQRAGDVAGFNAAQQNLDPLMGGLNTLVLLTSGLCVALAVEAISAGGRRRARQWLAASMGLGVLFCVIKLVEYAGKFSAGISPETHLFFGYYYGLTAFHFAHVLFGLGLLALVSWRTSTENVETAAAFWHMVDLIWILLYPLVYLLR
ncbi:cytochrome c oxidase subunit 3 family protein [Halomonas sp. MCCC 1A17488]|uniref:cytochrome c oxidase subunit 3 family protein n=1 Tax=unclassified Halomonas TaxID=2609666 RepID=UPI0018D25610|nr:MULTISPECIES: cytochrome c oxidase subunit 3 family protein [unclassified Halomonas]MCE8016999.1 cytochrome c oxidase subunit 3 family protein [Halomonas sp. MCCC 1A17488]MCG3240332.1 cytochrome c oxidase subunit 3 family protein [Halomonas sp. MCCC 1A17488]QPP49799.1 cytochrome c oxidase subunit 3 family protein [Halomonas sp. SS10-MC5]